jgi:hypothetical protein
VNIGNDNILVRRDESMSIKACLKEKMGYSKFYYNPEITKIHNNADARVEKPFSSSRVDDKSKGCVQVDSNNKNSYHKLSSDELHAKALLISQ